MSKNPNRLVSGKKWYVERIFQIAQDRRYITAIDVWAIILDAVFLQRRYLNIDGNEITGITAGDIATSMNMHLSSVYHNLKILQSKNLNLLDTEDLIGFNEKGRKVTKKVYSIPQKYYDEFRDIYDKIQTSGFAPPHKQFTFFNLLKIRGILSHYTALLHRDRLLVDDDTNEVDSWYHRWFSPLTLPKFNVNPGVMYRFTKEDMRKILMVLTEILEKNKDNYENETIDGSPILFSYLIFVPYTDEMMKGEWLNRDEFEEKIEFTDDPAVAKAKLSKCESDHDTFFRYGISCPVCGEEPPEGSIE
ncbi:MAG: hypothetical protein ACTSVO_01065 [Candidatus Heimdallarchaeaceae archaeon]